MLHSSDRPFQSAFIHGLGMHVLSRLEVYTVKEYSMIAVKPEKAWKQV